MINLMDNTESKTVTKNIGNVITITKINFNTKDDMVKDEVTFEKITGKVIHENPRHITLLKMAKVNGQLIGTTKETFLKMDYKEGR